jgi:hypothetical protein
MRSSKVNTYKLIHPWYDDWEIRRELKGEARVPGPSPRPPAPVGREALRTGHGAYLNQDIIQRLIPHSRSPLVTRQSRLAMRPLLTHGRYGYIPITARKQYSWPGGRRLAFYIGFNVRGSP